MCLLPCHFNVGPDRQGAGSIGDAFLLAVTAHRAAVAFLDHKLVDGVEKFLGTVFQAEEQIGGAVRGVVEPGIFRRFQGVFEQHEQVANDTARRPAQLAQKAQHVGLRDLEAQGAGGGGLHVMAFIDDQIIVFRQHAAAGSDIRQQQGVIDDDQMRALGRLARAIERAAAGDAHLAAFGLAAFILRGEAQPDIALGRAIEVDFAPVAAAAALRPDQDLGQHAHFIHAAGAALAQRL